MRTSIFVLSVVLGVLLQAGPVTAASVDTFAQVNLVQGVEARLVPGSQAAPTPNTPSDRVHFTLSGPRLYRVDVQMAALDAGSSWADAGTPLGVAIDSIHDLQGNLALDMPILDKSADQALAPSPRYIITLTYE